MGSKGHMPPPHMRRPLPGPGIMHPDPYGPGMHPPPSPFPHFDLPPPEIMEQKLAAQHMEMQVLLTENQRLAATHGTLRQELAATQNELQMLQSQTNAVRAEKEQQVRNLSEKIERMSSELQSEDAVKADLEQARSEAQKLALARQELISKAQHLTHELQRVHADVQKVPFMVQELESIRQEFQHCRATYDYEKKLYNDHLESLQNMEKNYFNMAKEMEKLRGELTASANMNRRPGVAYGSTAGYNESDASANHPAGQISFEDSFAAQHARSVHPAPAGGVGVPPAPSYFDAQHGPGYDVSRVGSFYDQQRGGPYDPQMQMGMYNHPQPPPSYYPQQGIPDANMQAANATSNPYGSAAMTAPPPARSAVGAPQPRPGNPCLQSSHPMMSDLAGVGDEPCPVEVTYDKRRISHKYNISAFHKVCAKANGPALSLAYSSESSGLIEDAKKLPKATRIALHSDQSHLPILCHGECSSHNSGPVIPTDDCPTRGATGSRVLFQDDTRV
ncbi:unnamed protein product [Rhodiola kirilowii]